MVEVWLTGPVDGVHPLLMPPAHAFLQIRAEIAGLLEGLTIDQLWRAPGTSASIGFHAVHLAGATDRLLTYARGEPLSDAQITAAKAEARASGQDATALASGVVVAMEAAVEQVRRTSPDELSAPRAVGRLRLPSTVLGLVFHAAEHATRHAGQIATLRKIVTS